MKFKINSNIWCIKEVPVELIGVEEALAITDYKTQEIRLWEDCKSKRNTLKHELCHVWLWEYAHTQDDNNKFNYEQICDIVANSNDFINKIIDRYFSIDKNKK